MGELKGSAGLGTLQGSVGTTTEVARGLGCAVGSCLCQDAAAPGVTLQLGVRTGRTAHGPSLAPTAHLWLPSGVCYLCVVPR